jgi:hypothetical protein
MAFRIIFLPLGILFLFSKTNRPGSLVPVLKSIIGIITTTYSIIAIIEVEKR